MKHHSWVIEYVIRIDEVVVGFCGEYFRTSDERRHVIAAYLSAKPPLDDEIEHTGNFLRNADHGTILSAAYGIVPEGMRRALRRMGPAAQDLRAYTLLHQLLAQPPHVALPECIFRLPTVSRTKLLIARMLPEAISRPNVVEAITDAVGASDVAVAFHLLVSRGVDAEALAHAICKVRSERELMNLWHRWLIKARCPDHPVPGSDAYKPITSGEELNRLSLEWRNCGSKRYLIPIMAGEDAMAVFHHAGKNAMVHLRHSEGRWRFEGAYGPRNAPPPSALRDRLYEHLEAHAVVVNSSTRREQSEWDSLRRMTRGTFDFDF